MSGLGRSGIEKRETRHCALGLHTHESDTLWQKSGRSSWAKKSANSTRAKSEDGDAVPVAARHCADSFMHGKLVRYFLLTGFDWVVAVASLLHAARSDAAPLADSFQHACLRVSMRRAECGECAPKHPSFVCHRSCVGCSRFCSLRLRIYWLCM